MELVSLGPAPVLTTHPHLAAMDLPTPWGSPQPPQVISDVSISFLPENLTGWKQAVTTCEGDSGYQLLCFMLSTFDKRGYDLEISISPTVLGSAVTKSCQPHDLLPRPTLGGESQGQSVSVGSSSVPRRWDSRYHYTG